MKTYCRAVAHLEGDVEGGSGLDVLVVAVLLSRVHVHLIVHSYRGQRLVPWPITAGLATGQSDVGDNAEYLQEDQKLEDYDASVPRSHVWRID